MDKLTEILENGIQAKRMGNYDLAVEYYEKAREISPLDKRIFGNIFRIYIGLERYEDALRNLLIICSNNRLDRLIETDMKDPIAKSMLYEFKGRFNSTSKLYNKGIFNKVKFEPGLIPKALEKDELLNDLIFRADNLTYYIGHSFIGLNSSIISSHNIPIKEFRNLNNSLLGNPTGSDLREHKTSGLFLCIGFIFAHMNINPSLKSKEDVVSYYLDKNNKLNFEISSYRAFLENEKNQKGEKNSKTDDSIDFFLEQIVLSLKNELACECFYEYKSVNDYKTDMALQLHLPILLMEMGLKLDDVMSGNNFICTVAIEIDEFDNIVSSRDDVNLNDWDVEHALESKLNTAVTSVGAITKDERKFRTLKFLIKQ